MGVTPQDEVAARLVLIARLFPLRVHLLNADILGRGYIATPLEGFFHHFVWRLVFGPRRAAGERFLMVPAGGKHRIRDNEVLLVGFPRVAF